jgi:flagellar biosynthesis component FlhA
VNGVRVSRQVVAGPSIGLITLNCGLSQDYKKVTIVHVGNGLVSASAYCLRVSAGLSR